MLRKLFEILRQSFRRERYRQIKELIGVESLPGFRLDLGGGPASFFASMTSKPEKVILLDVRYDLARKAKQQQPAVQVVVADGERLPFATSAIDITICNSVIEHVDDANALASEVCRVSQKYFLQTPNGKFPLETHSYIGIPFYNFLPGPGLRRFVCKLFGANYDYVSDVHYLSESELRTFFPGATITHEKIFGLKKSFYIFDLNVGK